MIRLSSTLLLLLACVGATAAPNGLPSLRALDQHGARVAALVVNLDKPAVIASLHSQQRLTPASVTKLYTTAAALRRWGPDHRFTTRLVTDAEIADGVLHGDLILLGAGDPALTHADLWLLVARLRQRGITRISGDVVVNISLFGPVGCITKDRCHAQEYSEHSYDAPVSAAGVNYSNLEITVLPAAQPGEPATLVFMPPLLDGFSVTGAVTTVQADEPASLFAWRATGLGVSTVHVTGQVPVASGRHSILRSVANPSRYAGQVLAAVLAGSGIMVKGEVAVRTRAVPNGYRTLASVVSQPLANQLRNMLTYSNNYMADMLTLDLLAYDEDAKNADALTLPRAASYLVNLAKQANRQAADWLGPAKANIPLTIDTGSGLSITNRISARDIVALLAFMAQDKGLFPAYAGALPVPRYTPSHTLKGGNQAWANRLSAKTGTLTEPVTVRALAGYLRLHNGDLGAFAVLVNGSKKDQWISFDATMAALMSDLEAILAGH